MKTLKIMIAAMVLFAACETPAPEQEIRGKDETIVIYPDKPDRYAWIDYDNIETSWVTKQNGTDGVEFWIDEHYGDYLITVQVDRALSAVVVFEGALDATGEDVEDWYEKNAFRYYYIKPRIMSDGNMVPVIFDLYFLNEEL